MAASKWIDAAVQKESVGKRKGSLRHISGKSHAEPDADDRGGMSDHDADDSHAMPLKKKKKGIVAEMNTPMGY